MPHFAIKHRLTGATLFAGEFGTMRECVEAAVKAAADLTRTDLSGAVLSRTDLRGAILRGAVLSRTDLRGGVKIHALAKTCSRSDDYEFLLWDCEGGIWRITAGCRFFTLEQAWAHWLKTRDNTPLGEETFDILVLFEHHAERVDAARKAQC